MSHPVAPAVPTIVPAERAAFLGLRFDTLPFDEALRRIRASRCDGGFGYIVTPNVDHIVRLHDRRDPELFAAYSEADYCFCDSQVLRLLARPFGIALNTITGSDLLLHLIPRLIRPGDRINLVGGDARLAELLRKLLPAAEVRSHFPPMGMLAKPEAIAAATAFIEEHPAEFTLLCCGSPQQELVAYRTMLGGRAQGTALCIGAAVEFLVHRKSRAPRLIRRIGFEWLHRLMSEPRRLWRRYLLHSPRILWLTLRWARNRRI